MRVGVRVPSAPLGIEGFVFAESANVNHSFSFGALASRLEAREASPPASPFWSKTGHGSDPFETGLRFCPGATSSRLGGSLLSVFRKGAYRFDSAGKWQFVLVEVRPDRSQRGIDLEVAMLDRPLWGETERPR